MVTIIRDRVEDLVKKGMTLDQVKAANPTAGYNARYGASAAFVQAIYDSLRRN